MLVSSILKLNVVSSLKYYYTRTYALKDRFYEKLAANINSGNTRREINLILGDFNANIINEETEREPEIVGAHAHTENGMQEVKDQSMRLAQLTQLVFSVPP